ncbi:hypothetical protein MRB53_041045 [Persea americana]|nr:hypothetical protein MRB53_041045 [Persea americana]
MYNHRSNLPRSYAIAAGILLCVGALLLHYSTVRPLLSASDGINARESEDEFPRKIWQTWEQYPQDMDNELQRLSKTWTDMNREYRYELLTSESAATYVRDHFKEQPQIIHAFEKIYHPILRADLIRYLTLLAEGGIYTDIDTDCSKPIREWIPQDLLNVSNVVLGIEIDSRGEEPRPDLKVPAGLCQWTLMSKPQNHVIQHVVDTVVTLLNGLDEDHEDAVVLDYDIVMRTTGPQVFTAAVLEALTLQTGQNLTHRDLSNIDKPKLIGVLILPVSAFASGQDHSGSKPWGNEEQLVSHHWKGHQGWNAHVWN